MRKIITIILTIVILSGILPAIPVSADEDGYFHSHPCYMAFGPWVWNPDFHGGAWMLPPTALSGLDLRSIPEMSQKGGTPGYGIFFCKENPGDGYVLLGNLFSDVMNPARIRMIENRWGIELESYTINGTIWELFVEEGDPTGETHWKPLDAKHDGTLVIDIQGFSPVIFAKDSPRYHYPRWQNKDWGKWKHWKHHTWNKKHNRHRNWRR